MIKEKEKEFIIDRLKREESFSADYLIEQMQRNYERFSTPFFGIIKQNNDLMLELDKKTQKINNLKAQLAHVLAPHKEEEEMLRLQEENAKLFSQIDDLTNRIEKFEKNYK